MKRFVITLALFLAAVSAALSTNPKPASGIGPTIPPNPWESRLSAHPKPVALTSPIVKGKCPDDYPEGTGGVPCCGCRSAKSSTSK